MHDILINWTPQETRVALIENGAVQDLHIERALERGLVGNVYLGKVARVLPGMQSAFIEVGLDRAAFLHVADLHGGGHHFPKHDVAVQVPIERQVFEGQTLTVQVIKDAIGSKGARLSAQVSIAGRMLVFLPHDNHIGISQKIGSHELREQLPDATIIVDAGVGVPSDAAIAMELGADAILMNTAIAEAGDAAAMATAMNLAVQAGRLGYLSGRMPKRLYASASSPIQGAIK